MRLGFLWLAAVALLFGCAERPPEVPLAQEPPVQKGPSCFPHWYLITILFAPGSARLDRDARNNIEEFLADYKKIDPAFRSFTVMGYADRMGSAEANLKLALARAVADAFIEGEVRAEDISVRAMNEYDMHLPTRDGIPEQANRAVSIKWRCLSQELN